MCNGVLPSLYISERAISAPFKRPEIRADIDYCHAEALTKVGLLGIKVWICRGEVFGKKKLAPNFTQSKESGRGNNGGNNGGKNFKRKKNNR